MHRFFVLSLCFLIAALPMKAAEVSVVQMEDSTPSIAQISEHHPRLLISDEIMARVHGYVGANKLATAEYEKLTKRGEQILKEPPVKFVEGDLLEISRLALKRIYILGMLYQMKPEAKWAVRAKAEMSACCAFPSWHPDHFLDTAEMTQAMAIGYDWFFTELNDTEKATIRTAIFQLGLNEGLKACANRKYFWTKEHQSNWSVVCFGGLLMGALAVGKDDERSETIANALLPICIDELKQSVSSYGPDGAWCEGLNYWNYSSIYATSAIAALDTSLHTDFGLSQTIGLEKAGFFFIDAVSPNGLCFNFADAVDSVRNSPQLFWLSRRYNLPVLAYKERQLLEHANDKLDPRDLIWFSEAGTIEDYKTRPLVSKYRGSTQMVAMRTSWVDPKAAYFAMKGGDNATHHSHLDLGTFVFDSDGYRWAIQPGMENYDLPGYFDTRGGASAPRWQYYRTRTEGQNTPLVNGSNQDTSAKSAVTECNRAWVNNADCTALDLNEAYKSIGVTKFSRVATLLLHEPGGLFLLDSLSGTPIFDAVWQMHTRADVKIDGAQAILSFGDKKLLLKVLSPMHCHLSVDGVKLSPPQLDSAGIKKVTIGMASATDRVAFAVLLVPFTGAEPPATPDFNQLVHSGWNK